MRKFLTTLAAWLVAVPVFGQVPTIPFDPPAPTAYTHYVDNTVAGATDINNPFGTPARPRLSVPPVVPAGTVVEVRGGPYNIGGAQGTIVFEGTAANPSFVRGVGSPTVVGAYGARLTLTGQYGVWEGMKFSNVAVTLPGTYLTFRGNEIFGHSPPGNSSALSVGGRYVTLKSNLIHHNGNSQSPTEVDVHGMLVLPGAYGVWVVGNTSYSNGGDSIQVGQAQSTEPWAQGIFISGNVFHEDRENAIDIKKSRDVIVYANVGYGYRETSSSAGEVIVTHDGAERVWILNNLIYGATRGIVASNAQVYVVAGNIVVAIVHNPSQPYDPLSLYGSHAILTYNSYNVHHVNNTVWYSDGGISLTANSGDRVVVNNLVRATNNTIVGTFTQNSNNNTAGDPKVVDPTKLDFRLLPDSPLRNGGLTSPVWAVYQFLYGVALDKDIYGGARPNGAWDIGAAEGN